jgi:hypothetical protein
MDFPNFDLWNSAPSYPMPSPNFQDEVLGFDSNPAFETASTLTQVGPTQYGPHSLNASPLPHDIQPQSFQSFSDTRATSTPPMGPPTGTRKRKAPILHASDWELYKARITCRGAWGGRAFMILKWKREWKRMPMKRIQKWIERIPRHTKDSGA